MNHFSFFASDLLRSLNRSSLILDLLRWRIHYNCRCTHGSRCERGPLHTDLHRRIQRLAQVAAHLQECAFGDTAGCEDHAVATALRQKLTDP